MTVGSAAGDIDIVASPIRLSDDAAPVKAIPAIGQHSDALRKEFGG